MKEYLVMFEGKELGKIKAKNYDSLLQKIEEVITIEEVEE